MRVKGKCSKCGIDVLIPLKWWVKWKLSKQRNEKAICIGCSGR